MLPNLAGLDFVETAILTAYRTRRLLASKIGNRRQCADVDVGPFYKTHLLPDPLFQRTSHPNSGLPTSVRLESLIPKASLTLLPGFFTSKCQIRVFGTAYRKRRNPDGAPAPRSYR